MSKRKSYIQPDGGGDDDDQHIHGAAVVCQNGPFDEADSTGLGVVSSSTRVGLGSLGAQVDSNVAAGNVTSGAYSSIIPRDSKMNPASVSQCLSVTEDIFIPS
jgi:hypothetical protein